MQSLARNLEREKLVRVHPYLTETYRRGALPNVLALADAGVTKAFDEGWATDSTKRFTGHSLRTIEHEVMISCFHINLERQCDVRWRQRQLDKATVRPDALFAIGGTFFFLEMERAKLGDYQDGSPSIMRKLSDYRTYYNSVTCRKDFGFSTFHVVVVMRTAERARNLLSRLDISPFDGERCLITSEDDLFRLAHPDSRTSFSEIVRRSC